MEHDNQSDSSDDDRILYEHNKKRPPKITGKEHHPKVDLKKLNSNQHVTPQKFASIDDVFNMEKEQNTKRQTDRAKANGTTPPPKSRTPTPPSSSKGTSRATPPPKPRTPTPPSTSKTSTQTKAPAAVVRRSPTHATASGGTSKLPSTQSQRSPASTAQSKTAASTTSRKDPFGFSSGPTDEISDSSEDENTSKRPPQKPTATPTVKPTPSPHEQSSSTPFSAPVSRTSPLPPTVTAGGATPSQSFESDYDKYFKNPQPSYRSSTSTSVTPAKRKGGVAVAMDRGSGKQRQSGKRSKHELAEIEINEEIEDSDSPSPSPARGPSTATTKPTASSVIDLSITPEKPKSRQQPTAPSPPPPPSQTTSKLRAGGQSSGVGVGVGSKRQRSPVSAGTGAYRPLTLATLSQHNKKEDIEEDSGSDAEQGQREKSRKPQDLSKLIETPPPTPPKPSPAQQQHAPATATATESAVAVEASQTTPGLAKPTKSAHDNVDYYAPHLVRQRLRESAKKHTAAVGPSPTTPTKGGQQYRPPPSTSKTKPLATVTAVDSQSSEDVLADQDALPEAGPTRRVPAVSNEQIDEFEAPQAADEAEDVMMRPAAKARTSARKRGPVGGLVGQLRRVMDRAQSQLSVIQHALARPNSSLPKPEFDDVYVLRWEDVFSNISALCALYPTPSDQHAAVEFVNVLFTHEQWQQLSSSPSHVAQGARVRIYRPWHDMPVHSDPHGGTRRSLFCISHVERLKPTDAAGDLSKEELDSLQRMADSRQKEGTTTMRETPKRHTHTATPIKRSPMSGVGGVAATPGSSAGKGRSPSKSDQQPTSAEVTSVFDPRSSNVSLLGTVHRVLHWTPSVAPSSSGTPALMWTQNQGAPVSLRSSSPPSLFVFDRTSNSFSEIRVPHRILAASDEDGQPSQHSQLWRQLLDAEEGHTFLFGSLKLLKRCVVKEGTPYWSLISSLCPPQRPTATMACYEVTQQSTFVHTEALKRDSDRQPPPPAEQAMQVEGTDGGGSGDPAKRLFDGASSSPDFGDYQEITPCSVSQCSERPPPDSEHRVHVEGIPCLLQPTPQLSGKQKKACTLFLCDSDVHGSQLQRQVIAVHVSSLEQCAHLLSCFKAWSASSTTTPSPASVPLLTIRDLCVRPEKVYCADALTSFRITKSFSELYLRPQDLSWPPTQTTTPGGPAVPSTPLLPSMLTPRLSAMKNFGFVHVKDGLQKTLGV